MAQAAVAPEKQAKLPILVVLIDHGVHVKHSQRLNHFISAMKKTVKALPDKANVGIYTFGSDVGVLSELRQVNSLWKKKALQTLPSLALDHRFSDLAQGLDKALKIAQAQNKEQKIHIALVTNGYVNVSQDFHVNQLESKRILLDLAPKLKAYQVRLHIIPMTKNPNMVFLKQLSKIVNGHALEHKAVVNMSKNSIFEVVKSIYHIAPEKMMATHVQKKTSQSQAKTKKVKAIIDAKKTRKLPFNLTFSSQKLSHDLDLNISGSKLSYQGLNLSQSLYKQAVPIEMPQSQYDDFEEEMKRTHLLAEHRKQGYFKEVMSYLNRDKTALLGDLVCQTPLLQQREMLEEEGASRLVSLPTNQIEAERFHVFDETYPEPQKVKYQASGQKSFKGHHTELVENEIKGHPLHEVKDDTKPFSGISMVIFTFFGAIIMALLTGVMWHGKLLKKRKIHRLLEGHVKK